ncbi:hypothetical protein BpHYR1_024208 [Brachionus plicatilis]|uniref:Uncharacterized protein n=1 Tax=Brachionus plicatilis TaxID=10195 RepID=A0A3M7SHA6_BRAPC|nr:hypothetical protein BpHYR1_024208 [Brachionus plicatilis]
MQLSATFKVASNIKVCNLQSLAELFYLKLIAEKLKNMFFLIILINASLAFFGNLSKTVKSLIRSTKTVVDTIKKYTFGKILTKSSKINLHFFCNNVEILIICKTLPKKAMSF